MRKWWMRTKGQALTPFLGSEALQKWALCVCVCALGLLGSRWTTVWISNQQNVPLRTLTVQLFIFNAQSSVSFLLLTPGPKATKGGESLFLHMSITEGSQDRSSSFHSYTRAPWSKRSSSSFCHHRNSDPHLNVVPVDSRSAVFPWE